MVILSHVFIPTNYGHLLQHKMQTIKKITKTNFHPQNECIKIYTPRSSEWFPRQLQLVLKVKAMTEAIFGAR